MNTQSRYTPSTVPIKIFTSSTPFPPHSCGIRRRDAGGGGVQVGVEVGDRIHPPQAHCLTVIGQGSLGSEEKVMMFFDIDGFKR